MPNETEVAAPTPEQQRLQIALGQMLAEACNAAAVHEGHKPNAIPALFLLACANASLAFACRQFAVLGVKEKDLKDALRSMYLNEQKAIAQAHADAGGVQ